ncbi:hypothetical protein [Paremcibacter congregatus]|uniref:hypothetical protein n=1 Tax=Paremcibacter congregatus TaxID=2043170 RepID=UPI0030EED462
MRFSMVILAAYILQVFVLEGVQAQDIFDRIKSKVKKEVDNSLKTEKKNPGKSPGSSSIKDADKLDLYGGHNAPWNVAPHGSTKVQSVSIKGIHLGMPEVLIDEILTKDGYEKIGFTQYSKEIVEINGEQREVTRSQQSGKSVSERGTLIKRYIIDYKAVAVDDELLEELDGPLKTEVARGQVKLKAIKEKYVKQSSVSRSSRTSRTSGDREARPKYDRYPVDTSAFKLIYEITYTQAFAKGSQYDKNALMAQIKGIFGNPTYAPQSTHARDGSAFGTDEYSWFIYHDAALVSVAKRESLLQDVEKKGDRWALKNAFSHPCGASPYDNKLNCVVAPITTAYPDLARRLDAAKIIYAPVMMVNFRSPVIKTKLAWEYIKSAPSIRDYYNKVDAQKKLPKAKADF